MAIPKQIFNYYTSKEPSSMTVYEPFKGTLDALPLPDSTKYSVIFHTWLFFDVMYWYLLYFMLILIFYDNFNLLIGADYGKAH